MLLVRCLHTLILCAVLALTGPLSCTATAQPAIEAGVNGGHTASEDRYLTKQIGRLELQHEVMRFAESYINAILGQTFLIQTHDLSPKLRSRIRSVEHNAVVNAINIAIGPDPVVNLLDMVVYVTLGRMNLEKAWDILFPEVEMAGMHRVLVRQEKSIWAIAAKVLSPEYQKELKALIREWWDRHPDLTAVSRVRFGSFATLLGDSKFEEVGKPGFLLPEISEATEAVDEVRDLSERLLFYMKYAPYLARTTAETGLYDALSQPETIRLQSNITRFADAAERFSVTTAQLPDDFARERKILLDQLMEQEERLRALSSEIRDTLTAGDAMAQAVNGAARSLDALFEGVRTGRRPGAQPFEIRDYAETAKEIGAAAQQLDSLLTMLGQLPSAPGLDDGLAQLEQRVDSLLARTALWIGSLILFSIVSFFLVLFAFRYASKRVLQSGGKQAEN